MIQPIEAVVRIGGRGIVGNLDDEAGCEQKRKRIEYTVKKGPLVGAMEVVETCFGASQGPLPRAGM